MRIAIVGCQLLLLLGIAGCGGDSAGGSSPTVTYTPGVFPASSTFAARCENPRFGFDPSTGARWPDRAGSALHEKHYLRSWTNELYLWFSEVPDSDPVNTGGTRDGVEDYFQTLKTQALTSSGRAKDQFHFTYDTDVYRDLITTGSMLGYGISWAVIAPAPPRQIQVQYVQAGTAAASAGITRGATLLRIDGINVVTNTTQAGLDAIYTALYEPAEGSNHTFEFRDRGSSNTRTVTFTAAEIAFDAVPVVDVVQTGGKDVGYLLFNDHSAAAEADLFDAIDFLADAQVDELVLDLRYNGGGYLDIASELAYMIAGSAATTGRTFERMVFNSKYPTTHPLTGSPLTPMPFHSTGQKFSVPAGTPLPTLDLDRVFVLTSSLTCSASESIINGLRGVGIQVIQIGGNTCGKPYGFYPQDNCGTTYFSIQFQGVNDMGFGDYAEGFSATRTLGDPQANLPGCGASDDLSRDLGNPTEGQLQAALTRLNTGACPTPPPGGFLEPHQAELYPDGGALRKPPRLPWKDNRILR